MWLLGKAEPIVRKVYVRQFFWACLDHSGDYIEHFIFKTIVGEVQFNQIDEGGLEDD